MPLHMGFHAFPQSPEDENPLKPFAVFDFKSYKNISYQTCEDLRS